MGNDRKILLLGLLVGSFIGGIVGKHLLTSPGKKAIQQQEMASLQEQNLELSGRVEMMEKLAKEQPKDTQLGAFAAAGFNVIDTTSSTVTTTKAVNATLVLPTNRSRIYGAIQNDSDTDVYIYLANFTDQSAASTTVIRNQGIRLPANGGFYEMLPENIYTGQVWVASTTVAGKSIMTVER